MTRKPSYIVAVDAMDAWRDSLFSGERPELYSVGAGALSSIELGPGRVVLIGGLPGGGKTALSMQLVVDALRAAPTLRAVVANVEMTPEVLLDRQLARLSGIPLQLIANRALGAEHADRLDKGLATLAAVAERLAFVTAPFGLKNIGETAVDFKATLLALDYLQRLEPLTNGHADKRGRVDAMMDVLRRFADAGCGVLAISAVSRTKDRLGRSSYDGAGLGLASFRESSELEFGCDTAYVLVPDVETPELVLLKCLKHRHGEPKDVFLTFERRIQNFRPLDPTPAKPDNSSGGLTSRLRALWSTTPAAPDNKGGGRD